jgi:hypothetical protein
MLELLLIICCSVILTGGVICKIKTLQPLTTQGLEVAWKMHKQHSHCGASVLKCLLTRGGKVVGFKCNCGYKYLQKKSVTQGANYHPLVNAEPITIKSKIKSKNQLGPRKKNIRQGLSYLYIEKI